MAAHSRVRACCVRVVVWQIQGGPDAERKKEVDSSPKTKCALKKLLPDATAAGGLSELACVMQVVLQAELEAEAALQQVVNAHEAMLKADEDMLETLLTMNIQITCRKCKLWLASSTCHFLVWHQVPKRGFECYL